jgi:hypothetical protein
MAYLCSDVVRTNPEDRQTHASIPPWIFHAAWCWAENFIPFFVSKVSSGALAWNWRHKSWEGVKRK